MSDETQAPEADQNMPADPAADAQQESAAADAPAEPTEPNAPELDAGEDAEADAADESPLEDEADEPAGGILGDHERKPTAGPGAVKALRAGEARITREQLAEIRLRRAQADLSTLLAACEALLDELEA